MVFRRWIQSSSVRFTACPNVQSAANLLLHILKEAQEEDHSADSSSPLPYQQEATLARCLQATGLFSPQEVQDLSSYD